MAEAWNRVIIINLSLPLTLTTQDNCRLSYSTNPDWSHSHLNCANSGCQKLKLIGPRDALPCLLSSDNGMRTALMPQLCSGSPQSKGSPEWRNKWSSPHPKVTQIYPNAGEALAVLRRWQVSPSFPLEPTSPALCSLLDVALDISHTPLVVSYEDWLLESLIKRFLLFFFATS